MRVICVNDHLNGSSALRMKRRAPHLRQATQLAMVAVSNGVGKVHRERAGLRREVA